MSRNNEIIPETSSTDSLELKVAFLKNSNAYADTSKVEWKETHMSWVFLTDRFVYKLKKPVHYDFLDFRTMESRYGYCREEVRLNQWLAKDIYLGVVPLTVNEGGEFELNGKGRVMDWLVWMKRLPEDRMLKNVILNRQVQNDNVRQAAELLADFYIASPPLPADIHHFRHQLMEDIETNSTALLRQEFTLSHKEIVQITTSLIHFVIKHADLLQKRIDEGRILEAHGDLRPEHICLTSPPVIMDRLEFNKALRILDVAEELAFLSMECEMLDSSHTSDLFATIYEWKSGDKIPDALTFFYKAKRALLRAKLSIHHLLEDKYHLEEEKWKQKCDHYLSLATGYCSGLPKEL